MVYSQRSSFVIQNDQISRVPLCVQKWSNPKGPPLGSEIFKSQGSPLGFKSGRIPKVPLGIRNGQITRVRPWFQKWSNTKGLLLCFTMIKSQGSPFGFKSGRIQSVPAWEQKCLNPKG